ncbi:hypothetical protein [Aquimarina rubra]|uniref:Uncharacterized protein n=1 Tax=Aquimarina rubra TaxID=1920033 RepID=A0ABW5LKN9_9FLAO
MSIAQLDGVKGGNFGDFRDMFPGWTGDTDNQQSEQPAGGICYSGTPTSCIYCV